MSEIKPQSIADFVASPLWDRARWSGTTFRWHPTGSAPPVMGLCFECAMPAQELFSSWTESRGNAESLWISIVEGHIPGQQPGYSVHISANPKTALVGWAPDRIATDSLMLLVPSRVNRMQLIPGSPILLPKFKCEYKKHREFLLAPVTRRGKHEFWIDIELGIVQTDINFRSVADIGENDYDLAVLRLPATPRPSNITG